MAGERLTRDLLPGAGLAALVVVTASLVTMAVLKVQTPPVQATPAPVAQTSSAPSPKATATPTAKSAASATPKSADLATVADAITADGASILVIGDGSGDDADEWVSVWARDHLADKATVSYRAWNRTTGRYADAVKHGSATRTVSVWNASVSAPAMSSEPERIAQAWQDADVVLVSYGHRRSAKEVSKQLDAVLATVRGKGEGVPVVALIQNPDRADTEAAQRQTTLAIKKWADAKGLPTVDLYSAFVADPRTRAELVESDGSPTPNGSALWAKALAQALADA